jgi:hypothetical protein
MTEPDCYGNFSYAVEQQLARFSAVSGVIAACKLLVQA